MLIRRAPDVRSSEITHESLYWNRREWIATATAALGVAAVLPRAMGAMGRPQQGLGTPFGLQPDDKVTPYEDITHYNNYYEFGLDKEDPAANAQHLRVKPWTVRVDGFVKKPADYHLEDFLKPYKLEDRIYRHRCVEAWSIVIPWRGFPLADLIRQVEPTSQAKFVEFTTLADPKQMPGVLAPVLDWPYLEGLRLDEAKHPLSFMVTGLYGKDLPNQNGAPLRLHVPWKYGFKSGKSIVRIRFTGQQPRNTWAVATPNEYGFYANVNPEVDHPRWSQATERRLGEFRRRKTLMFNGYADQVASLYAGMDLRKNF